MLTQELAIVKAEGIKRKSLTIFITTAYAMQYFHVNSIIIDPGYPIIVGSGHNTPYCQLLTMMNECEHPCVSIR